MPNYQAEFWGPGSKKGYRCADCGRSREEARQIDVHHLDESHLNDHPDNLVGLCRRCHLQARHERETVHGDGAYDPSTPRALGPSSPSAAGLRLR